MDIPPLQLYPAFGFDIIPCDRWEVAAKQRQAYLESHKEYSGSFRFYSDARIPANLISKFLGYIPILNIIVGIARIILMSGDLYSARNPAKIETIKSHIYRGIAEIAIGPFLLIVDIIQSIRDYRIVSQYRT